MSAPAVMASCWRCSDTTDGTADEVGEYPTYCRPCRAAMVLPCDCGGIFDRSGRGLPACDSCDLVCGYWDDDDLIDPDVIDPHNIGGGGR